MHTVLIPTSGAQSTCGVTLAVRPDPPSAPSTCRLRILGLCSNPIFRGRIPRSSIVRTSLKGMFDMSAAQITGGRRQKVAINSNSIREHLFCESLADNELKDSSFLPCTGARVRETSSHSLRRQTQGIAHASFPRHGTPVPSPRAGSPVRVALLPRTVPPGRQAHVRQGDGRGEARRTRPLAGRSASAYRETGSCSQQD